MRNKRMILVLLCILIICIFFTSCQKPMTNEEIMSIAKEIDEASKVETNKYSNPLLGIQFTALNSETFKTVTIHPYELLSSEPDVLAELAFTSYLGSAHKGEGFLAFIFKVSILDIPQLDYKKFSAEEFAQNIQRNYISRKQKEFNEEYNNLFEVSPVLEKNFNDNTFYEFFIMDKANNVNISHLFIRENNFIYNFSFYNVEQLIDERDIEDTLNSVLFFKLEKD